MTRRSIAFGLAGAGAMMAVYTAVLSWASGVEHLGSQISSDWYLLAPIIAGFGIQVGLLAELHRRRRDQHLQALAGAGAGSSTAGMVACCAHHIADLTPILGASGVATALTAWRIELMVIGVAINAVGVTLTYRRLRGSHLPRAPLLRAA